MQSILLTLVSIWETNLNCFNQPQIYFNSLFHICWKPNPPPYEQVTLIQSVVYFSVIIKRLIFRSIDFFESKYDWHYCDKRVKQKIIKWWIWTYLNKHGFNKPKYSVSFLKKKKKKEADVAKETDDTPICSIYKKKKYFFDDLTIL